MSERKESLEALLALIEAGTKYETMGHTRKCQKAFPPRYEGDCGPESHAQLAINVWIHDSLDAAKALYDEVIHERVVVEFKHSGRYGTIVRMFDLGTLLVEVESDNPASAWLQAIIIALIAATDTEVT